ncbi:MAG: DUF4384 domain-containing protein [Myxococcota bacterium]
MVALFAFALVGTTTGCFGHYHRHDRAEARAFTMALDAVMVQPKGEKKSKPATLDTVFATGDKVALVATVEQPAYLYVVNFAPGGEAQVVWPSGSPRRVNGRVTLPRGGWFQLSGATGPETVVIVASPERFPLTKKGKANLIREARKETMRSDLIRVQAARPPGFVESGHATIGLRGERLDAAGGLSARVRARFPVIIIDLDHRG